MGAQTYDRRPAFEIEIPAVRPLLSLYAYRFRQHALVNPNQ
jgi:hypothetical protein